MNHKNNNRNHAQALLDLIDWTRRCLVALRNDRRADEHVVSVLRAVIAALRPETNPRLAALLEENGENKP
ncbi:MAG: hypothetical protein HY717_09180 [Planctomycetes bacterium]|nr:hypothetical protein [Planctomycetota bacterium]